MKARSIVWYAFLLLAIATLTTIAAAQQVVDGSLDDGSLYEFQVPSNWDGNLVLYAHEYFDPEFFASPNLPVLPPPPFPALSSSILVRLRAHLLDRGYAVGYSSYARNGWALQSAITDTHALRGIFSDMFGPPKSTYLVGVSMGGLVVTHLAERYPEQYSGVLALCGVLGGTQAEVNYIYNARVLYDFFFKKSGPFGPFSYVLPGGTDLAHPPTLPFFNDPTIIQGVVTNLTEGLTPPYYVTLQYVETAGIVDINEINDINEIVEGPIWALGFAVTLAPDLLATTHGHLAFDNLGTVYHDPLDDPLAPYFDPLINSSVLRYEGAVDALLYLDHFYQPTGDLSIPMWTLHTTRDPSVPLWNESNYYARVHQRGNDQNLHQESIAAFGHCGYSLKVQDSLGLFTDKAIDAFDKLTTWATTGVRPE